METVTWCILLILNSIYWTVRFVSFQPSLGLHRGSLVSIPLRPFTVAEYIPASDDMRIPGVYPLDLDDGILDFGHDDALEPMLVGHTKRLAALICERSLGFNFTLPHRGNENRTEVAVLLAEGKFIRGERGLLVFCKSFFHAVSLGEPVKNVYQKEFIQNNHIHQSIDFLNYSIKTKQPIFLSFTTLDLANQITFGGFSVSH